MIDIIVNVFGWGAVAVSLFAFFSKTMIPLRIAIIAASCLSIVWAWFAGIWPILALHCLLLPLNILRLREMRLLIAEVRQADSEAGTVDFAWLKPYMHEVTFAAGDSIFRQGEEADSAYVIGEGQVALTELGVILGAGNLMGEMGLFSSGNKRMSGAHCMSEVRAWRISYLDFEQLYFQNPQFGFHIMRLMVRRMESNLARFAGQKFATQGAAAAPPAPGAPQA